MLERIAKKAVEVPIQGEKKKGKLVIPPARDEHDLSECTGLERGGEWAGREKKRRGSRVKDL